MDVNDDSFYLDERVALAAFAGKPCSYRDLPTTPYGHPRTHSP